MYETRQHRRQAVPKSARSRRRRHGQVPPARRLRGLRHARAHGAGLLAALPAGRRPGQLRLDRRRPAGGDALHRGAADRSSPTRCSHDIDKETVDFGPNYDGSESEPMVLPARRARTCWSTARPASRSAWRPTSRRTTWARSCDAICRADRRPATSLDES